MPLPKGFDSQGDELEQIVENLLEKILQNEPKTIKISDETVSVMSNFVGLPPPRTVLSEENKVLAAENAINFLRVNRSKAGDMNKNMLAKLAESKAFMNAEKTPKKQREGWRK